MPEYSINKIKKLNTTNIEISCSRLPGEDIKVCRKAAQKLLPVNSTLGIIRKAGKYQGNDSNMATGIRLLSENMPCEDASDLFTAAVKGWVDSSVKVDKQGDIYVTTEKNILRPPGEK